MSTGFHVGIVGIAALLMAGCGATEGTGGATGTSPIGGADHQIVFGYRSDAPPFSYEAAGDIAAFSGFSAEICNRLSRELATRPETAGVTRSAMRVTAEDRFGRLEAGDVDVLCGAASITPERLAEVGFSIPLLETGVAVAVTGTAPPRFAGLTATPDLESALRAALSEGGGRIGFRSATTTEDWLATSGIGAMEGVSLTGYADHGNGIAALEAGEIDLYMGDRAILRGLKRTEPAGIRILPGTVQGETIALATQHDAVALRRVIDALLADLYRSGEIEPIFERHFGPMTAADRAFYAGLAAR